MPTTPTSVPNETSSLVFNVVKLTPSPADPIAGRHPTLPPPPKLVTFHNVEGRDLLVFVSPVTKPEKDRDQTGPRPIRDHKFPGPQKTETAVRSLVLQILEISGPCKDQ